jgi:hypothetical protein
MVLRCGTFDGRGAGGDGGSSYVSPQAANAAFGLDTNQTPEVTITPIATMPPAPPIAPAPAVALTALRVSPSAFAVSGRRVADRCQPLTHGNRKRAPYPRPIALHINHKLNTRALVTFRVEEARSGRSAGGRCVVSTHANRHKHTCRHLLLLPGTLTQTGIAGVNSLLFTGRIGGRKLGPGSYRVSATPAASSSTGPRKPPLSA